MVDVGLAYTAVVLDHFSKESQMQSYYPFREPQLVILYYIIESLLRAVEITHTEIVANNVGKTFIDASRKNKKNNHTSLKITQKGPWSRKAQIHFWGSRNYTKLSG